MENVNTIKYGRTIDISAEGVYQPDPAVAEEADVPGAGGVEEAKQMNHQLVYQQ